MSVLRQPEEDYFFLSYFFIISEFQKLLFPFFPEEITINYHEMQFNLLIYCKLNIENIRKLALTLSIFI